MVSLKTVRFRTRAEWRSWLAESHDREPAGIWLVFQKKRKGVRALGYEEAVEEALCYGWIDSVVKATDEHSYCRKFTPRKDTSCWSVTNKRRAETMIAEGRMTEYGWAKIRAAKKSGAWDLEPQPVITLEVPPDLSSGLADNPRANGFFEKLAPSHRKQFIGWIVTAKRPETRAQRVNASVALLARGEKLGPK